MKHSTRLADLLQSTFGLHRARVTCLAALVIALFRVRTVNLAQLATAEQENACDHLQQNCPTYCSTKLSEIGQLPNPLSPHPPNF